MKNKLLSFFIQSTDRFNGIHDKYIPYKEKYKLVCRIIFLAKESVELQADYTNGDFHTIVNRKRLPQLQYGLAEEIIYYNYYPVPKEISRDIGFLHRWKQLHPRLDALQIKEKILTENKNRLKETLMLDIIGKHGESINQYSNPQIEYHVEHIF